MGREDISRPRRKEDIPDRWQDYTAVGKRLKGTRFIAFKVPLKQALIRTLPPSEVFGPWELLDALKEDNYELGLIIDLTFTTRYYNLQDLPQSLLCVKIFTAGHEVPSDQTILSFKRTVHRFLRDNQDNDKLIGVHCTHGLNRTGYLICRYLIDVDGMAPAQAVQLFNSSRGYAIERQNYLDDLQHGPKRSNAGMEECEQEPQRGQAVQRPPVAASPRRVHCNYYRSHRRGGPSHRSHPYAPQPAHTPRPPLLARPPPLLARPPLLAHPPLAPPPALFHPYRWAPQPPAQWRAPHSGTSRSRYPPPPVSQWNSSFALLDRGGALPNLPHYCPNWTSVANGDGSAEGRSGPNLSNQVRTSQRPSANGYDGC
ncbi:RNA/RNP complex-1-interacting phosphatase-like [Xiphophorus couchianus]|uniref:RNA/RNP complex-1-interacting phosphatase-like n=1 Tax=Xiphophorus couchianus TaxID=32473 RepID=UPI0010161231|nr:RNA/RNP complex-1-interacting phosphatase-like [Xiphophorus couchianus]